jgi:hypothetical protein
MGSIDQGKFQPTYVDDLRALVSNFITDDSNYQFSRELKSNIAYNLQYLEYIDFILSSQNKYLGLTNVVKRLHVKTFIITTTGIIEAILYYLLVDNNLASRKEWKQFLDISNTKNLGEYEYMIKSTISRRKDKNDQWDVKLSDFNGVKKICNGRIIKIKSQLFVKVSEPELQDMTLDQMIKKAESKKLLGVDNSIYSELHDLRDKRNKVHVRIINEKSETDYHSFEVKFLSLTKKVLSHVLKAVNIFTDEELSIKAFSYLDN